MKLLAFTLLLTALNSAAQIPSTDLHGPSPALSANAGSSIIIPAGTSVSLAVTNPVWTESAKSGDGIYAQTTFPVAVNNRIAIPTGTYAQGQIDAVTRPGRVSSRAQIQIHFTKIIFESGYTVELGGQSLAPSAQVSVRSSTATPPSPPEAAGDVIAAVASAHLLVSPRSDVLLDNGTQIEMVLQLPLRLDASSVAAAVRLSNPRALPSFQSATRCRSIPGSPGTPDTVISGTPGTPGTPDVVIPGAPGTAPTVIPGIPATPGTPDTVLHGSPGRPYIPCPPPPVVTFDPKPEAYRKSFQTAAPAEISGRLLPPGTYSIDWKGLAPVVQVDIVQNGKIVMSLPARVVLLSRRSPADQPQIGNNADGSLRLESLRFGGENFALYFD